jgi:broad specificity phosphatase PhoE
VSDRVLYLIRHGRADYGSEAFTPTARGEQFDPPLSETGREQARLLARRLNTMEPPTAVYCSPLRRAAETIAPWAETTGTEVRFDEDLMEAHVGQWERMSFEEILATDEEILRRLRNQEAIWHKAPGGERIAGFRARVGHAVDVIAERHPSGDLWIVCHGGVINQIVAPLLGIEHEMFFLPENTSVNSVVDDGGSRRVRFLNDVLHLTDPHLFEDGRPASA